MPKCSQDIQGDEVLYESRAERLQTSQFEEVTLIRLGPWCWANCSRDSTNQIDCIWGIFFGLLHAVGHSAQSYCICLDGCFMFRGSIRHCTRNFRNFGHPAAIGLTFNLYAESQISAPCTLRRLAWRH